MNSDKYSYVSLRSAGTLLFLQPRSCQKMTRPHSLQARGCIHPCLIYTVYPVLEERKTTILNELTREEHRFRQTLSRGPREFQKQEQKLHQRGETILSGEIVFRLFDTFGFPPSLTAELAQERGLSADLDGFDLLFQHGRRLAWERCRLP